MIDDVLSQLRDYGLIIDQPEIGKLKRVDVKGDRPHSKNGWYSLFEFGISTGKTIITGAYGSWKKGDSQKVWLKGLGATKDERAQINARIAENKRIAENLRTEAAGKAAKSAWRYWERSALSSGDSDYLARKMVKGHGVRYSKAGAVVVPLFNVYGSVMGLQFINNKKDEGGRDKFFWPPGMSVAGNFFMVGEVKSGKPICIAEGYATAASIHESTGYPVAVVFNSGNIVPASHAIRSLHPDCPMLFCADDDWRTTDPKGLPYNPGLGQATKATLDLKGYLVKPKFKNRKDADVDFNDLHVSEGQQAVRECFKQVQSELNHWRQKLKRTGTGTLCADPRNIYMILSNDQAWADVLGFCQLSYRVIKRKTPPFPQGAHKPANNEWITDDTNRTDVWLAEHYGISAHDSALEKAIDMVARDNAFHPVKNFLKSLRWDKQMRLHGFAADYLGAEDNAYASAVSRKWFLGAVARVMMHPVKVDNLLILEGDQGLGKSTVFSILGGDWYSDTHFQLGDKDGYQQMQGVWICELAELDSFNKAESSRAKGFFSSATDRYRPVYDRRAQDFPRQCVFGGTTNQEAYFKDFTGNRRYWPIKCTEIDLESLQADRDQLWAEAYHWYQMGVAWHVLPNEVDLFQAEQEDRLEVDSWETLIQDWVEDAGQIQTSAFTLAEIFMGALRMEPAQFRKPEQLRLAQIMQKLNWHRVKRGRTPASGKHDRVWKYERVNNLGEK